MQLCNNLIRIPLNRYSRILAVCALIAYAISTAPAAAFTDVRLEVNSCPYSWAPLRSTCIDPGVITPIPLSCEPPVFIVGSPATQECVLTGNGVVHPLDIEDRQFSSISATNEVIWNGVSAQGGITRIYNGSLTVTAGRKITVSTTFYTLGSASPGRISLNAGESITGIVGIPSFDQTGSTWTVCANAPVVSLQNSSPARVTVLTGPGCEQPKISISATQNTATEGGAGGVLTISRTGSTGAALTVNYTLGGSAANSVDYQMLPGALTIPAGQSSGTINLTPVVDGVSEGPETVFIQLETDSSYTLGTPTSATVTIFDPPPLSPPGIPMVEIVPGPALPLPNPADIAPRLSQGTWDQILYWIDATSRDFPPEILPELLLAIENNRGVEAFQDFLLRIGEAIPQGLSSAIARVLGPFLNVTEALLSDEIREASPVLIDFYNNRNDEICRGMTMQRCQLLRQIEEWDGSQPTIPIVQPKSVQDGTSSFSVPVQKGTPILLDPDIAIGFEYNSVPNGPQFSSFVLPYLGSMVPSYLLETTTAGNWTKPIKIAPLTEYRFIQRVDGFRVSGIDPRVGLLPEGHIWLTALTFDRDGLFEGSIRELTTPSVALPVIVRVKPGESPNSINPKSSGKIPVVILSTVDFDAREINWTSLRFGRTGNEKSLDLCHLEDSNDDGLPDLACHFNTRIAGFRFGDSVGVLKGQTLDQVAIIGSDSIRIVP